MKKNAVLLITVLAAFCLASLAWAVTQNKTIVLKVGDPYMTVNGEKKEVDPGRGTKPVIVAGRTLLPIRTIVESIDGQVGWQEKTQTVNISVYGKNISLEIGSVRAQIVEGSSPAVVKTLDVAPQVINGRTMVPVRFVTENLGAGVNWDEKTQSVTVQFGQATGGNQAGGGLPAHSTPGRSTTGGGNPVNLNPTGSMPDKPAPDDCASCHSV